MAPFTHPGLAPVRPSSTRVPYPVAVTGKPMAVSCIDRQGPLGQAASSISFKVATDFTNLQITFTARSDQATARETFFLEFNGDTGSNYGNVQLIGNNGAVTSSGFAALVAPSGTSIGSMPGATGFANAASSGEILIPAYTSPFTKLAIGRTSEVDAVAVANEWIFNSTVFWSQTQAITSITLLAAAGNFVAGSVFSLYGWP